MNGERDGATVVLGERRYVVERNWVSLPDHVTAGLPTQVAVDPAGRVHCLQRTSSAAVVPAAVVPAVAVFDHEGGFAFTYGETIADAHGIYCDAAGRIFITDRDAHQVLAFSSDGEALFELGERNRPRWQAPFNHPCDAAVAGDGRIYVADGYGNACVHRFGAGGEFELSWGSLGREPGRFMTPHAVWADARGHVLVADRENGRIQRFSAEGELVDVRGGLQNPMDIWVDGRGFVFVTDQVPSLVMFTADGELAGRCRPSLNGAHGIFGDASGNLYLSEMNPPSFTRMRLLA